MNNKGLSLVLLGVLLASAGIILFSVAEFVLIEYPKECIFLELDFSSECLVNTWDSIIAKRKD